LGTLTQTANSIEALQRRDVPVRGIVCNQYEGTTLAERTNPDELERMTEYPVETEPPIAGTEPRSLAEGVGDALSPSFLSRLWDGAAEN